MMVFFGKWRRQVDEAAKEVSALRKEVARLAADQKAEAELGVQEVSALRDEVARLTTEIERGFLEISGNLANTLEQLAGFEATMRDAVQSLKMQSLCETDLADLRGRHAALFAENKRLTAMLQNRPSENFQSATDTNKTVSDSRDGGATPE